MKRLLTCALVALLPLAGTGCNWLKSPSKDNVAPPAELTEIPDARPVQQLWSRNIGEGVGKAGIRLRPVLSDGRLYVADGGGTVQALNPANGATLWRSDADALIGSSPAVGLGLLAVGTLDGALIVFDADDGSERWRAALSSEVIAAPAIGAGLVLARSHDGRLYAFDAKSGERRWVFDRGVPLLSLRGNGAPVITGERVLLPGDNGKMVALKLSDGTLQWEQALATPEGRTELARMVDIDGDVAVGGGEVYAATYQGQVGALTLDAGRQLWSRDFSAYGGIVQQGSQLFASDAEGSVWALDARSGTSLWKQDALAHRNLSTPARVGDLVAVGDFEGYVHWLKSDTGELVARTKLGGKGIPAQPASDADVLYVASAKGELAAYRVGG